MLVGAYRIRPENINADKRMHSGVCDTPLRLYVFPVPLVSPEKAFAGCGVPVRRHFRGLWRRGVAVRHRFRGLWRRDAPLRRHSGGFGGRGVPLRQHSGGLGGRDAGVRGYVLLFCGIAGGINMFRCHRWMMNYSNNYKHIYRQCCR